MNNSKDQFSVFDIHISLCHLIIDWNWEKQVHYLLFQVKTKCKNKEHDVVLPAAKDNIREYKIDINSTHLTLYCQDKIIASDPADCDDDFVPNKWMTIAKVGFNSDLKDDGAKKMIKKGKYLVV